MKEFDKIYIAKYYGVIEDGQIYREFNIKKDELENIIKELKQNEIYEVYKNLTDDEWETLEKKSDLYVLSTYLPQTPGYNLRIFNKIVANFKEEIEQTYKSMNLKYINLKKKHLISTILKKKILMEKNGNKLEILTTKLVIMEELRTQKLKK